jgi:hypothetical protein
MMNACIQNDGESARDGLVPCSHGTLDTVVNLVTHKMELEQNNVYQSPLNGTDLLVNHRKKKKCTGASKTDHEFLWVETSVAEHSRIRIHIKEFKYFNPKNIVLSSRKYDGDVHPGSGPGHRIQIHNSGGNKTKRLWYLR